jgi:uracil phosphoribosyltransferase
LPADNPADVALVLDPMLATGGSIRSAVGAMKKWGVRDVRVLSVIAAPEGIRIFHEEFPDVPVYVAAIDEELNSHKFIVPGLGDAGDRIFNT